ncbi:uncharacterized protein YukE [Actinoplanes lutulentus]|uniref:Outer membrane channel protein CpnT-like N-terminal domain-containing protein n=1 Tax=Actinoplanes lutulentus TaxID=1287878 RepID=A0A327ZCP9_9ACTN|nr:WXG100 family type VII secretion target [Actinoplanes lutulentus]MBB2947231.1 uncharacterized protein YukE [Actinoplanes lutulentus]RAK36506.1 hypothetical protein B0I29_10895 [Actinoplanes lutulentus]
MPIDTRLDGRPEQVYATARWLRDRLAFEVDGGAAAMRSSHADAAQSWRGAAGAAFGQRIDGTAGQADRLHGGLRSTADGLEHYAGQLAQAQAHMARARQIAADGGLPLAGDTILEPVAAPTPQQVESYQLAQAEADRGNAAIEFGRAVLKNMGDDITQKWHLFTSEVITGGLIGSLATIHRDILRAESQAIGKASEALVDHYLKTPGGTPASKALNEAAYAKYLESSKVELQARGFERRFLSKIPVAGAVITAAGVGYDIAHGKPVGKSVLSGAGNVGGALVGAKIGAAIGISGGPVGIVVGGAIGGIVGGVIGSGLVDAAYDALPDNVTKAFEDGLKETGTAITDGVKDVGSAIGDGAKDVGSAISGGFQKVFG